MKAASPELVALLATRRFCVADLWAVELASGSVLRHTSADVDITANGQVFTAKSHLYQRGLISQKCGVEVATMDLTVYPREGDLVDGQPFFTAVQLGFFDESEITLERAFMAEPGDPVVGTVIMFAGRSGQIEIGDTSATIPVNSHMELLNAKVPGQVYQPACPYTCYDTRCRLDRAAHQVATTVCSGATNTRIPLPGLGQADGWATLGVLAVTSGALAGQTRHVHSHASGVITVYPPLPSAPAAGVSVLVAAGCAKTMAACAGFGNSANYGGMPFVPSPVTTT
mgnify:CR=1 FL=1